MMKEEKESDDGDTLGGTRASRCYKSRKRGEKERRGKRGGEGEGMKRVVNQHEGVRGQDEEEGLYKPKNTEEERGRHASEQPSPPIVSFLHPSASLRMEGWKRGRRKGGGVRTNRRQKNEAATDEH